MSSLYCRRTDTSFSSAKFILVYTHHLDICLIIEGLSKDRHDKDVDEKRDEQSNR